MSWIRRLLQSVIKPAEVTRGYSPSVRYALESMPTVKFDPSTVTKNVKADLRRNIELLRDLEKKHIKQIYKLALCSVVGRGDLHLFCTGVMNMHIEGMTSGRAAEIGRSLGFKASAIINRERQAFLGLTHAKWVYANAPCIRDPRHPTAAELKQDAAHCSANGKRYEVSRGLFVDDKWTWPGHEDDCKCVSRSVVPGWKSESPQRYSSENWI